MEGPKWTDIAIVILTCGIVLLAYMQWSEMHGTGKQTDDLINAARIQAGAATKNAEAAASFAASADRINTHTKEAVDKFQRMAESTKAAADTSARASTLQDRPWVGMVGGINVQNNPSAVNVCKIPVYHTSFLNVGHSPALHATTEMEERIFEVFPTDPPYSPNPDLDRMTLVPGIPVPNQGGNCGTITEQDVAELRNNPLSKKHIYIYGRLLYDDQTGMKRHHTYFCSYFLPFSNQLAACPTYNDAN